MKIRMLKWMEYKAIYFAIAEKALGFFANVQHNLSNL